MGYLFLFFQSNILEWPIYLPLLFGPRARYTRIEGALLITAINTITHPIVFFFFMKLPASYLCAVLLAETFAVATEAMILIRLLHIRPGRAGIASLFANLCSWQLAPVLTYLFFR